MPMIKLPWPPPPIYTPKPLGAGLQEIHCSLVLMFGQSIDVHDRNEHPHQMCPLHVPSDNAIHPHIPLIQHLGLERTLGSCATSKLMDCGLPLSAFGLLLLLGVPSGVDSIVYTKVPLNPILCHEELLVVCSLHLPSLLKPYIFLCLKLI
jgi:hypothetical protein